MMRSRSLWFGLVGTTVGGGAAGFGAALLFGVQAGFSQPLATFLAGAGALSAGILAYLNGERTRDLTKRQHEADTRRERERHQEDSRHAKESALRDRYTAIAAQIADESAAIRQARVYALTALADDWHAFGEDDERQVCINLLRWYLRVPFPENDVPQRSDLPEREIRQTIVKILSERRRRPADDPKSWATAVLSLHYASLQNCALSHYDFTKLNLTGADLAGADLLNAKLTGAKLLNANLTGATLYDAKLTGAFLADSNLRDANLISADLAGASLNLASLVDANLAFANLTGANLSDTDLTGANLNGANLTGANLTGANLTGANVAAVNAASPVSCWNANLTGANLTGANLTDASFIYCATYDETTHWPEGFTPPQPDA